MAQALGNLHQGLLKVKWDWAPILTIFWVGLDNGIQYPDRILRDKQKAQRHQKGRVFETEENWLRAISTQTILMELGLHKLGKPKFTHIIHDCN